MDAEKVCKDYETKYLGEYYDLCLKKDKLLLADVFENYRKMCLEIRSCNIIFSSRTIMEGRFKKNKVKLELPTDIKMLLSLEKGV